MLTLRTRRTPVPRLPKDQVLMQIIDRDRLRLHRVVPRYSLRRVQEMCGKGPDGRWICTYQAILNWETGRTRTIPEPTAIRLSQVLNFTLASVFAPNEGFVVPETSSSPGTVERTAVSS